MKWGAFNTLTVCVVGGVQSSSIGPLAGSADRSASWCRGCGLIAWWAGLVPCQAAADRKLTPRRRHQGTKVARLCSGRQSGLLCLQGARSARSSLLPSLLLGRDGLRLRLGERLGDLWEQRGAKGGVAVSSWEERRLFVVMCAAGVGLGGARRAVRACHVLSGPSRLQADQTKRLQAGWSTQQRGGSSKREPRSRSAPPAHLARPA